MQGRTHLSSKGRWSQREGVPSVAGKCPVSECKIWREELPLNSDVAGNDHQRCIQTLPVSQHIQGNSSFFTFVEDKRMHVSFLECPYMQAHSGSELFSCIFKGSIFISHNPRGLLLRGMVEMGISLLWRPRLSVKSRPDLPHCASPPQNLDYLVPSRKTSRGVFGMTDQEDVENLEKQRILLNTRHVAKPWTAPGGETQSYSDPHLGESQRTTFVFRKLLFQEFD